MITDNIILTVDSYKASQWLQYPPGTTHISSYVESRGGISDEVVFFGLQKWLRELRPITMSDIDEAEEVFAAHGEPFNRAGWEHILDRHRGYLPVAINALPEGTVIGTMQVLAVIINTDPKCFWLTSYLETAMLRAIWYPTTVATNSRNIKKVIRQYLVMSGDTASIDFKLHDFGARGVSSGESAGIGGLAHLVNFKGTDTIEALITGRKFYYADMPGFSIPASEHSTITSWGRNREIDAYRNMIKQFGEPGKIFACVSDAYDIYAACRMWGGELKQEVIDSGATLVVRPDSGDPATVVFECIEILDEKFGHTVNAKGFKVLNNVRVIQGDGINIHSVDEILKKVTDAGYSADNVNFGMGGALLQIVNRDDQKFAMKCSLAYINGWWVDVFKDPITDHGKVSKKGFLTVVSTDNGLQTLQRSAEELNRYGVTPSIMMDDMHDRLAPVFFNGELEVTSTLDEIRERAAV